MTTQSVLDMMTASVIDTKAKAGAKLTPVGLEAGAAGAGRPGRTLGQTAEAFPNDLPADAIIGNIAILREQLNAIASADQVMHVQYEMIQAALVAAETALGAPRTAADASEATKAKERAADARVAGAAATIDPTDDDDGSAVTKTHIEAVLVNLDAKAAEAQAATFAAIQAANAGGGAREVMAAAMEAGGWQCPVHGNHIDKVSRLGRDYRACPECKEFEKL